WELLYSLAADASVQARVRAAVLTQSAWNWMVTSCPQPLVDLTQVATLLALYGDGATIPLADKYATWAALYRTPLKRVGDDWVWPWTEGFINWEKRYITQD